jgi:hypothetical protein
MKKKWRKNSFIEWLAAHPAVTIVIGTCLLLLTFLMDFLSVGWKNSAIRDLMIFVGAFIVGSAIFALLCVFINCFDIEQKPKINEPVAIKDPDRNLLMNTLKKAYYTAYGFIKPQCKRCLAIFIVIVITPLVIDLRLYSWHDSMFRMIVFMSNGIVITAIALSIVTAVLMVPFNYFKSKFKSKKERSKNID